MRENPRVYAYCKDLGQAKNGVLESDRLISFGLDKKPMAVELFFMFRDKDNEPLVALEEIGREKGVVLGAITDSSKGEIVVKKVPIDDLADPSKVTSYTI